MFIDILLLAKRYDWIDVCRAIDACCKSHAFNEKAVLLELQGSFPSAPSPTLDVSGNPLLQQSATGIRSLNCYDSLIDSMSTDHVGSGQVDYSFVEPVSSPIARSAIDDQKQESYKTNAGVLPSVGIPSSLAETTVHACGVPADSQAVQFV
jgi:hypothetical protein